MGRAWFRPRLPLTWVERERPAGAPPPRELIVLLHGYEQIGRAILSRLGAVLPEGARVVAPDGPFPVPRRTTAEERTLDPSGARYRMGNSWYFYDFASDEYVVEPDTALDCLTGLVRELGAEALPKWIIGFSQGGYLAGILAGELSDVRQVIGIGAGYLWEEVSRERGTPTFRWDGVHGEKDEYVELSSAERAHAAAVAGLGLSGRFVRVAGEGHRISAPVQAAVAELLAEGARE